MACAPAVILAAMSAITACTTAEQRRADENAAIKKRAAEEVERICALSGAEREAELEKFRRESGMELYCPK